MRGSIAIRGLAPLLFALALPVHASAQEAVVTIACTISSSEMHDLPAGSRQVFKIGEGRWQVWSQERGEYFSDFCGFFEQTDMTCSLSPGSFHASGYAAGSGSTEIRIDRQTGALTASAYYRATRREPAFTDRAYGSCVPATDPAPPSRVF